MIPTPKPPEGTEQMMKQFAKDFGIEYTKCRYDEKKLIVRYVNITSTNSEVSSEVIDVPAFIVGKFYQILASQ